jgi:hypothetical protein
MGNKRVHQIHVSCCLYGGREGKWPKKDEDFSFIHSAYFYLKTGKTFKIFKVTDSG